MDVHIEDGFVWIAIEMHCHCLSVGQVMTLHHPDKISQRSKG